MTRILLIDTSTAECSVALSCDGRAEAVLRCSEPRMQASLLAPLIRQILTEAGLAAKDLDAVCLSKGPGSYTGLRVGTSTAKGICFGAGLPLMAVDTLQLIATQAVASGLVPEGCRHIVPMVDARRMEVYAAVFSPEGRRETDTRATVVEADTYASLLAEGPVLFTGDGAEKCREILGEGAVVAPLCPDAAFLAPLALAAWNEKRFEDLAYFEPFYLKDFVATVPRKPLF